MRLVRLTLAPGMLGLLVFLSSNAIGATPPALYKGSAQALMPSAAEAGFAQITSQGGRGGRASATYENPGTTYQPSMKLAVRAFKTETAAISSFNAACAGCPLKKASRGNWKYKIRVALGADRKNTITFVARCRNLRVDTLSITSATNPHQLAGPSKRVAEDIFGKAQQRGMSSCAGGGTKPPPPKTGTYFWSESFAEDVIVTKLKIPYCNIDSGNPNCGTRAPIPVVRAECRGLDEKKGTFTYSRFTCEIQTRSAAGRIAVWPTGPTTFRWEIL